MTTLIPAMPFFGAGFILMAASLFVFRHQTNQLVEKLVSRIVSAEESFIQDTGSIFGMPRGHLLIWFLVCSAFILVHYWPTLVYGFFRHDDFKILSFIRSGSLWEIIFVPHDDHTNTLFHLALAAMLGLFGVSPLAYNIVLLFIFILMLFFTVLIMREMRVNVLGILVALTLITGLAAWGETISGYYTQTIHPAIALSCLVSIWAYIRWEKTSNSILPILSTIAMGAAVFVDISGFWVPPAVLTFAVCHHFASNETGNSKSFLRTRLWIAGAALGTLLLGTGLVLYVFTIVAPGDFLRQANESMPDRTGGSPTDILQQLFYIVVGGVFLPAFFPIGYWRLPAPTLLAILTLLSLLAVGAGFIAWRKLDRPARWYALSFLLIILGTCFMAVLGRRHVGFSHAWASKYIGTPYLWFCLLVGLVWNRLWKQTRPRYKLIFLQMTGFVLGLFLGIQIIFDVATSRIDSNPLGSGYGYRSNINDAKARKEALYSLQYKLIRPLLSQSTQNGVHVPTLDGLYINHIYPSHDPFNNLSYYWDFIVPAGKKLTFVRNSAMRRQRDAKDVQTVASLRTATDGVFVDALEKDPYIQRLYLSSVPLQFRRGDCKKDRLSWSPSRDRVTQAEPVTLNEDGQLVFESKGESEFLIQEGQWDPETAHRIELGMQVFSSDKPVRLEFAFSGELKIPYPNPWIELTSHQVHCISVDLLQVYAYALNPRVKDLALRFRTPGIYKISQVALQSR